MFQALPIMENDWKPVNCVKEKELEEEEKLDLTFKIYYILYLASPNTEPTNHQYIYIFPLFKISFQALSNLKPGTPLI